MVLQNNLDILVDVNHFPNAQVALLMKSQSISRSTLSFLRIQYMKLKKPLAILIPLSILSQNDTFASHISMTNSVQVSRVILTFLVHFLRLPGSKTLAIKLFLFYIITYQGV
jgi:hypothetical protein